MNILKRGSAKIPEEEDIKVYAVETISVLLNDAEETKRKIVADKLREYVIAAVQDSDENLARAILTALEHLPEAEKD